MLHPFNPYNQVISMIAHYKEQYEIHKHDFKRAMVLKNGLMFWENKKRELLN